MRNVYDKIRLVDFLELYVSFPSLRLKSIFNILYNRSNKKLWEMVSATNFS